MPKPRMILFAAAIGSAGFGVSCSDFPTRPDPDRTFNGEWTFTIFADTALSEMCPGQVGFSSRQNGSITGTIVADCASAFNDFTGTLVGGRISIAVPMPCDPVWVPLNGTVDRGRIDVVGRWPLLCQGVRVEYGIAFTGEEAG